MAIKSKHNIVIDIDGKEFKITVNEITGKQKKELEKQFEKHTEALKEVQKISSKLIRLNERYSMLKEDKDYEEAMKVLDTIEALEEEAEKKMPLIKTAADELEKVLENRLEMSVEGNDKDIFFERIKEKSISYKEVFNEIGKSIIDSKEKK